MGGKRGSRTRGTSQDRQRDQWLRQYEKNNTITEAEWLGGDDFERLAAHLNYGDRFSQRKKFLFFCAGSRHRWHLLEEEMKPVLEMLEKYVEGDITREDYESAVTRAGAIYFRKELVIGSESHEANSGIYSAVHNGPFAGVLNIALAVKFHPEREPKKESAIRLVYCIFGNPFRPVPVNLSWQTATVTDLAQAIYTNRAFDRMPILADALEDAGCTNADILNHCRQPGEHVRGCWVVDLLLGKS
jgi:hypothetical protein